RARQRAIIRPGLARARGIEALAGDNRLDERLPRRANQDGQAKPSQPVEPGQNLEILAARLAETHSGSDDELRAADAGIQRVAERAREASGERAPDRARERPLL